MFGRAHNLAHVCLRCQQKFAQQTGHGYGARIQSRIPNARPNRRQSTAAAAAVVEDGDGDHQYQENNHAQHHPQPLPESTASEHARAATSAQPRSRAPFKTRRLTRTAALGMNALGKPSEIIIINQKERDIPIVPTEPEARRGESLHDSLVSEKEPATWSQIKDNIEQVRGNVGQQRGALNANQWISLQTALLKGFTRLQLRKYALEVLPLRSDHHTVLKKNRSQWIRLIAAKIWGYDFPTDVPSTRDDVSPKKARTKTQTRTYKVKAEFKPMLETRVRYGPRIHSVSIDFKDKDVSVSGQPHDVSIALQELQAYTKKIKKTSIESKDYLGNMVTWSPDMLENLAQSMRSKHGLHVTFERRMRGSGKKHVAPQVSFKIWHNVNQTREVEQVRRELHSIAEGSLSATAWRSLASEPHKLVLAPSGSTTVLPWNNSKLFHRQVDVTPDRGSETTLDSPKLAVRHATERAVNMSAIESLPEFLSNEARVDYTAHYGQVLFPGDGNAKHNLFSQHTDRKDPSTAVAPIFTSEPVMVPQLLSSAKFQDAKDPVNNATNANESLAKMILVPGTSGQNTPSLELLLRGLDPEAGLSQRFEIIQAALIVKDKTFLVPRPGRAVDLKFTAQMRFDIREEHTTYEKTLFDALRTYLGQNSPLPLFVSLPVLHAWNNRSKSKTAENEQSSFTEAEYLLKSFCSLNAEARLAPLAAGSSMRFPLEHVWSHGEEAASHEEVLVLRGSQAMPDFEFSHFFDAAVDVADRLDDMGRQLRHRLDRIK